MKAGDAKQAAASAGQVIMISILHSEEDTNMKKQIIIASLAGMCLLTSCGNSKQFSADTAYKNEAVAESYEENYDYEAPEATEKRSDSGIEAEAAEYRQSEVRAINTQMLVYACDMSIDVLEFDESVDKLHALIDKYNGFLESENYSDGANTGKWQYSDEQKWKTLSTVIRIPSASYANFCKDAEAVGDMRRKNASVQNLTAEYSDLKTTLAIYEAKEKRYITLLSEMKSESEAISVEKELTNIQIEIARIKTRMTNIENDVAYSYINLTLTEVREYSEEPVIEETDTFGQRLHNTISGTWKRFLASMEGLLFLLIRLLPYLFLLGIVLFILNQIRKSIKKKRNAARAAKAKSMNLNAEPEKTDTAAAAEGEVTADTEQKSDNQ